YDVGVAWAGGHVLKQDVTVDASGTTRVTVELPRSATVRVVATGTWPTSVAKGANGVTFHLRVGLYPVGDSPAKRLPGRGERDALDAGAELDELPGSGASTALVVGTVYSVRGELDRTSALHSENGGAMWQFGASTTHRAVTGAATVEAGGEIRFTCEALGTW